MANIPEEPISEYTQLDAIRDMLIMLLAEQAFVDGNLAIVAKKRLLDAGILTH